jgi:hypothetical protein
MLLDAFVKLKQSAAVGGAKSLAIQDVTYCCGRALINPERRLEPVTWSVANTRPKPTLEMGPSLSLSLHAIQFADRIFATDISYVVLHWGFTIRKMSSPLY